MIVSLGGGIHLLNRGTFVSFAVSSNGSKSGRSNVVSNSILRLISLASLVFGGSSFLGFGGGGGPQKLFGGSRGIGIEPDDLKHETTWKKQFRPGFELSYFLNKL